MNAVYQTATFHNNNLLNDIDSIQKVNILWTGGLDSTLRMIELSKLEVIIQPYYLCDKRYSENQEFKAISAIIHDIKKHPETRCKILPLIIVKASDLEPDESVTKAYQRLYEATKLGSQFDWLARFAKTVPGLELGMEKSEISKGYNCVRTYGKVKLINRGILSYYVLDRVHSSDDLIKVFGNFHFPYKLFHSTKPEEIELFKKLGFEHIVNKTWFCHTPIRNKPCGVCHPCKSVVEEGLSFRLPPSARRRYERHVKYGEDSIFFKFYRIRMKIRNLTLTRIIYTYFSLTRIILLHRIYTIKP